MTDPITVPLSLEQWSFVANALRTAAEKYVDCAQACVEHPGLAATFAEQAETARQLSVRIQNEAGV